MKAGTKYMFSNTVYTTAMFLSFNEEKKLRQQNKGAGQIMGERHSPQSSRARRWSVQEELEHGASESWRRSSKYEWAPHWHASVPRPLPMKKKKKTNWKEREGGGKLFAEFCFSACSGKWLQIRERERERERKLSSPLRLSDGQTDWS